MQIQNNLGTHDIPINTFSKQPLAVMTWDLLWLLIWQDNLLLEQIEDKDEDGIDDDVVEDDNIVSNSIYHIFITLT
jgi:hypothetical protein